MEVVILNRNNILSIINNYKRHSKTIEQYYFYDTLLLIVYKRVYIRYTTIHI